MINVKYEVKEHTRQICLYIKGHADSGEYGKDLICSSVSILTYTLAQNVQIKSSLLESSQIELREGEASICCTSQSLDGLSAVKVIFDVIVTGIGLLADDYPEYVHLDVFGEA